MVKPPSIERLRDMAKFQAHYGQNNDDVLAWLDELDSIDESPEARAKLALAALDGVGFPVEAIFVISTSHVQEETMNALQAECFDVASYEHGAHGTLVYVPPGETLWWDAAAKLTEQGATDLIACMQKAHDVGCCWLLLDSDADLVPGLPTYNWCN